MKPPEVFRGPLHSWTFERTRQHRIRGEAGQAGPGHDAIPFDLTLMNCKEVVVCQNALADKQVFVCQSFPASVSVAGPVGKQLLAKTSD